MVQKQEKYGSVMHEHLENNCKGICVFDKYKDLTYIRI